jgi:hypothetical protein
MPLSNEFWHYHLPYKMMNLEHSRTKNLYLPVNRNYKPLGIISGDFVKYDDYIDQAIIFSRPLRENELFWNRRSDGSISEYYLYNDGNCHDFMSYLNRLNLLMKRKHVVAGSKEGRRYLSE